MSDVLTEMMDRRFLLRVIPEFLEDLMCRRSRVRSTVWPLFFVFGGGFFLLGGFLGWWRGVSGEFF